MPLDSIAEPPAGIQNSEENPPVPTLAWWRSLSLSERRALTSEPSEVNPELAAKRLARWQSKPFDDDELWRRRLGLDRLSLEALEHLLGEEDVSLEARAGNEPEWATRLRESYVDDAEGARHREAFPWPEGANLERAPFLAVFEPLIWRAHGEIVEASKSLETELFDAVDVATLLSLSLPDLLAVIVNRSMVVEMHIAKLEERLVGETPEARFRSFVDQLRDPSVAFEIFCSYPLMARQASIRIEQWRDASIAFLRDLAADDETLRRSLNDGKPLGRLAEARGDVSDPHRDGRGVLLLRFDSGLRAVYKPKSMRVEAAFQNLLDWLTEHGFEPALSSVVVVDAGDHGYMEWVEAGPCSSADELKRFYRRQGAYLCLFWLLDGTDFHHENLIASGEHPVFVDLETLFQPWVHFPHLEDVAGQPGGAMRSTVLRSDMLPTRWWGTKDEAGIDMSGLGSQEGQLTPGPVAAMTGRGTDEMRVERRRVEVPLADNRPQLAGREVSVLDHTQDLELGFSRLFDVVCEHRDALLAENGPLAAFAGAETRVLFRTTASYGSILLESYHPHLQGHALERDRLFDRLWDATQTRSFLEMLIPYERRDMERLDVPLFIARTDSSRAFNWRGEEVRDSSGTPLDFGSTGLGRVHQRIESLDESDRVRQLTAVHDSLEAVRLSSSEPPRPSYEFEREGEPARADDLLAKATRIGDRLLERAFETEKEAMWLAVDYADTGGWRVLPTGPDVFQGLPGIALFLGHLAEATGEPRFETTARRAVWALEKQIERDPELVQGLGSFNGWGGVMMAMTHLGVLWRDEALLDLAEEYALGLEEAIAEDLLLDVVAGSAGLAAALLGLHRHRPNPRLLELTTACGERLLETAESQSSGVGWKMPLAGNRALAGMSHGAAGIAMVLLQIYELTGDQRFFDMAQRGFDFERALFDPERGNWPDLRVALHCHGDGDSHDGDLDSHSAHADGHVHEMHADQSMHSAHADGHVHERHADGHVHEMHADQSMHSAHADGHVHERHADGHVHSAHPEGVHEMHAWCHGAPGVGIARLMGLHVADDETIRAEIDVAVQTTIERGLGKNHCLCHGDLGNLDFLLLVARRLGDEALEAKVYQLAGGIARNFEQNGPLFGLPGNLATPGLMTGLAGLGYGFLRLAAPDRVPSILALEPIEGTRT